MLAIFSSDDGTVQQYPTAVQDSRARKVSLAEVVEEITPPRNRHGIIGRLKTGDQFGRQNIGDIFSSSTKSLDFHPFIKISLG